MQSTSVKQKLLLEYLISSADTFALCQNIIRPRYFNPEFRKTVQFLSTYYQKYNATPSVEQIEAETSLKLKHHNITTDQVKYCATEIEHFCKQQAMEAAIMDAPEFIDKGDHGRVEQMVKDALAVSLNQDMGIDYFADPTTRLEEASLSPARTSTGWPSFDDALDGGLARTEVILFTANSGGGKSICLSNLARTFVLAKMNVLYISLELSEDLVSKRFDTMFTGVPSVFHQQKHSEIAKQLVRMKDQVGNLKVKYMPSGSNANDFRAYIREYELKYKHIPDLLIVDYLDIMSPTINISANNIWEKDKLSTEQLRQIGMDYKMFVATASQQNRDGINNPNLTQGVIAGGISKINTVDIVASIIRTDPMRAKGEIGFHFLKTRNSDGVGKTLMMRWHPHLVITDDLGPRQNDDEHAPLQQAVAAKQAFGKQNKPQTKSLMDLVQYIDES